MFSAIRIDESRFINFGGFVFALSQFGNTMDLAKVLMDKILGPIDDIPLLFFSVKKNGLIVATTKLAYSQGQITVILKQDRRKIYERCLSLQKK